MLGKYKGADKQIFRNASAVINLGGGVGWVQDNTLSYARDFAVYYRNKWNPNDVS